MGHEATNFDSQPHHVMTAYDLTVIGGGIVGLATALAITERYPDLKLALVEKETEVARHQTGRNSGVVHSGIYYKPGSLKARLCVRGAKLLQNFCQTHDLPYERVGKVIVATHERELGGLGALFTRGVQNGVPDLRLINPDELREIEPHAAGLRAIHSPHTAIVDYGKIAQKIAALLRQRGVRLEAGAPVTGIKQGPAGLRVTTSKGRNPHMHAYQLRGTSRRPRCAHERPSNQACALSPFAGNTIFSNLTEARPRPGPYLSRARPRPALSWASTLPGRWTARSRPDPTRCSPLRARAIPTGSSILR